MSRGKGKTKLEFSDSESLKAIVRHLMSHDESDRIQVAASHLIAFGSVSRVFSQMKNEGYLVETGKKNKYDISKLKKNPELKKSKINYGKGKFRGSEVLVKTDKFDSEFLPKWANFLTTGVA